MHIFSYVKAAVTTRQAAVFYGYKVSARRMTCCPFHPDRHPSMKVDMLLHDYTLDTFSFHLADDSSNNLGIVA